MEVEYPQGNTGLIDYDDAIKAINRKDEEFQDYWSYEKILEHRPIGNSKFEVKLLWDNQEETWEPMENIKEDDKFMLAKYAHDKGLIETPGWKWARRITKNPKKFIRMARIFNAMKKRNRPVWKFGVELPRNVEHAFKLDRINGNTLWADAITT